MLYYEFDITMPLTYHYTGKFQSPNKDWVHLTRTLTDFELMVVTEGTLYILENEEAYAIHEGEYFIQAPKSNQKGYQASPCSFYWLHFTPQVENYKLFYTLKDMKENQTNISQTNHTDQMNQTNQLSQTSQLNQTSQINQASQMSQTSPNSVILPNTGILKNIDKIIILMKQLQDSIRTYHNPLSDSYMATSILLELYNQMNPFGYLRVTSPSKVQILNDLTDYILSHIHENFTVSHLSMIFGYNEKYLSTFFHKTTGIPLKQYILKEKMEVAKGILTDTNKAISEIGYSLGFMDQHNFSKAFKKQVGLTPTEYRNTYANRMLFYE